MDTLWKSVLAVGAAAAILGSAAVPARPASIWAEFPGLHGPSRAEAARRVIADWPTYPALAARAMMERYGPPDQADALRLSWSRNGQWLRTVVHRTADYPFSNQDVLEQTVHYAVPRERWADLFRFGRGVTYDPSTQELSSRSSSEESNFLALNLAADVAQGRLSPGEAERFYLRTAAEALAGRYSRYTQGLLFAPARPRKLL